MADGQLGEADFYLEGDDQPTLSSPVNVGMVLWEGNGWQELNQRVPASFDQFEACIVPLDHLPNLAAVCRDLASRYEPSSVHVSLIHGVRAGPTGADEPFETRCSATGQEVRVGLSRSDGHPPSGG
jgi:hypothetical protein